MTRNEPTSAACDAVAGYLHENEPLTDLHIECRESASGRRFDGARVLRALERANRARYIPRVGWVSNFVTGNKSETCTLLALELRRSFGWYVRRTR